MRLFGLFFSLFLLLSACSLAPHYQTPDVPTSAAFKEAGKWIPVTPSYTQCECRPWWLVYQDSILTNLEWQVSYANQDLKIALAHYQQARALAYVARADFFPVITGVGDVQREKTSSNIALARSPIQYNDMLLGADLSYELDIWGRVRNQYAAAVSRARASAADLAGVSLSLHAELAADYFGLRADDERQQVLQQAVRDYQKAYQLTRYRHNGGASPESDVDQAKAQLEAAKTLATDAQLKREQLEHAIAVLIGKSPARFSLPPLKYKFKRISIGPGLPSTLLLHRPDVASAELQVQAANAEIGVARAAYFPDITLLGSIGLESAAGYTLFQLPSLFYALGPSATWLLFNGGKTDALVHYSQAKYSEAAANYRQTSLTAFREVEDYLVAIHRLDSEIQTQTAATVAANRALKQANYRYVGGIITYLDVIVVQNIALQNQLLEIDVRNRRQVASVQLIKALGGGW